MRFLLLIDKSLPFLYATALLVGADGFERPQCDCDGRPSGRVQSVPRVLAPLDDSRSRLARGQYNPETDGLVSRVSREAEAALG